MGTGYDHPFDPVILQALNALINADTWEETRQVLYENQAILETAAAHETLARLMEDRRADPDAATASGDMLIMYLRLLEGVARDGIDAAWAAFVHSLQAARQQALLRKLGNTDPRLRALINSMSKQAETRADVRESLERLIDIILRADNDEQARSALQRVLNQLPPDSSSSPDSPLRQLLIRIYALKSPEELSQKIVLLQHAIQLIEAGEGGDSTLQASLFSQLGISYDDNPAGDRAENIDGAMAAYQAALAGYTRTAFPKEWATTQYLLGGMYLARMHGNRSENREHALAAYKDALQVFTRDTSPELWAEIQHLLANIFSTRARGERAQNLEDAIAAYQAALEVYTRDTAPAQWAGIQNSLGETYRRRIRGERAQNLEDAIAACQAALEVYTRGADPLDWAGTQNTLGSAYAERIRGERAQNLEDAIIAFQAALEIYTRDESPQMWAATQKNLGNAYAQRISGERAQNIDHASAAYQAALQFYTREEFPQIWSETMINLVSLTQNTSEQSG